MPETGADATPYAALNEALRATQLELGVRRLTVHASWSTALGVNVIWCAGDADGTERRWGHVARPAVVSAVESYLQTYNLPAFIGLTFQPDASGVDSARAAGRTQVHRDRRTAFIHGYLRVRQGDASASSDALNALYFGLDEITAALPPAPSPEAGYDAQRRVREVIERYSRYAERTDVSPAARDNALAGAFGELGFEAQRRLIEGRPAGVAITGAHPDQRFSTAVLTALGPLLQIGSVPGGAQTFAVDFPGGRVMLQRTLGTALDATVPLQGSILVQSAGRSVSDHALSNLWWGSERIVRTFARRANPEEAEQRRADLRALIGDALDTAQATGDPHVADRCLVHVLRRLGFGAEVLPSAGTGGSGVQITGVPADESFGRAVLTTLLPQLVVGALPASAATTGGTERGFVADYPRGRQAMTSTLGTFVPRSVPGGCQNLG